MDKTKEPPAPLEFDSEGGTITDKGLETRVTVLRVQGWASLKNELESTFMSGAAVILQRMGHSYGRYLVRLAKLNALKSKKEVTAKSIMGILQDAARTHGWGRLTIVRSQRREPSITSVVRPVLAASCRASVVQCPYSGSSRHS